MSLKVLTLPAPSLRERSTEVAPDKIGTADFQAFLDELAATMYTSNGVGIAAPQVGRNERIIVVETREGARAFINPTIIKATEATVESEEGCLSVPGKWGIVMRAKRVTVQALDRHGRRAELDCKGLEATIFQHEIDHLDGVLFIDKVVRMTGGNGIRAV